ncbi:hypothetical protein DAPPUDRAFT_346307 [Daphnia pulex]|uniref:Uncharacterized protein n=1 Tax=Daphnia pulex TaxID=6669 RepID=E9I7U6_DAPPU|nr:hypothetical protein DAPPUDRAFT_346307 [Daphnia pulex]|eukprot:EFX59934.1 hypothetical protein DAPPUDRAFT_346307 [Daphnia pulex]
MSVTVAPLSSIAGQPSSYTFTLLLTIPHSTTFIVQIDVPSDTKFIASGATCTNCTASSMSPVNSSTFSFTASNPNNYQSFSFTISSFTNPRSVSTSLPWGIATKTVSPTNLISYSYANASIKNPNTLTANLSKSDSYYRSNTNPVKMTLTFFNQLIATDYIQLTFTSESYTGSNVTCSPIYGICSMFGTPSNVTVVKIIPNTTSIINGTL